MSEKKGVSKTVRLEEETHTRLEALRGWKQSYSQVVAHLLDIYDQALAMQRMFTDSPEYQAWLKQKQSLQKEKEVKP